jgi:hypothetical protein
MTRKIVDLGTTFPIINPKNPSVAKIFLMGKFRVGGHDALEMR